MCPEFPWVPSLMSPPSPGCVRCPAGTEPVLGLEYKWWNVLPPNMETTVLSGINFEYKGMAGTAAPPPPRPHGAGDVTELSPCPRRLGGGRGLHLHGSGSLRQRLHDPDAAGARLQVSASHIPGVPSPPPCRVPTVPMSPPSPCPQPPAAGAGGWGQQGGGADYLRLRDGLQRQL